MAAGGKTAEIRAGLVVLVGLVILAIGLFLVSGGKGRFEPKSRLTVLFENAGGISTGGDVFVAGQRSGEVVTVETTTATRDNVRRRFVAITIEIRRDHEIPEDSRFTISRSITNTVNFNIEYGISNRLATADTVLFGKRLATFDELVDNAQGLLASVQEAVDGFELLIEDVRGKVGAVDAAALQTQAQEGLTSFRETVAEMNELVRENRAPVSRAMRNFEEITEALKNDWGAMNTKVQGTLDAAGAAAEEIKGIVTENREGIQSIVQQLDDGMRRLGPALAQIEAIGREAKDAVAELRPELTRGLAAAVRAFGNFESLTEDLRTAPWKLINEPSGKETDDVHLYNAARLYVEAAGRVAFAVQDLETLRRLGVLGDPERTDLVEKTLASMQAALSEFDANQKRFTSLIESTADR
jgi:ABC-type transporter Mla subunit MlaD